MFVGGKVACLNCLGAMVGKVCHIGLSINHSETEQ